MGPTVTWLDVVALVVVVVVFIIPFVFIFVTAMKTRNEAALLQLVVGRREWRVVDNFREVFDARDRILLRAFRNSLLITVASVAVACRPGFDGRLRPRSPQRPRRQGGQRVLARRTDRATRGRPHHLRPPGDQPVQVAVGTVLIEVAYLLPFSVLLFRAFVSTIPRELDEAAMIDGCSGLRLFFRVIFPLLRPVVITVIVTSSVIIYNDFQNPLYFLPGKDNATVQLTLYNFQGQFNTQWNLLFMDVLLITIPPLIMFMFFNRKIVAGLTAGAIKG